MGLFDKFKKQNGPKKEPKLTQEPPKTNVVFKKELDNLTREEVEEKAEKIKETINSKNSGVKIGGTTIGNNKIEKENPLVDKTEVKFKSMEKGLDVGGMINEAIDDSITKNYGTEEKVEMKKRHDEKRIKQKENDYFYDRYDEAFDLFIKHDYENAIPIYREIIDNSDIYDANVSLAYNDLTQSYEFLHEYDKAISVLNEHIEVKKQFGEDYSKLEESILSIKKHELQNKCRKAAEMGKLNYYNGNFDVAEELFESCIQANCQDSQVYNLLYLIYIRNKDFSSAKELLENGIKNSERESDIHNEQGSGFGDRLKRIEDYLETGILVGEQLPFDSLEMKSDIKYAKQVLKEEDKNEGINLLEILIQEGSYSNTVYYTLYQTYMKDKKYDDAIRISDLAIENLGLFDQNRFEKWNNYKDKAIAKKEKELSK